MLEETVVDQATELDDQRCLVFLNMSGDVILSWDKESDEKVKALVEKKIKEGYSFFTMKKVVIDSVKIKRKVDLKGIKNLNNLVVDDEAFERLVSNTTDRDLAELLKNGDAKLSRRRRSEERQIETMKRAANADEVMKAKQAVAVKPIHGG